jgi:hypothetical protein
MHHDAPAAARVLEELWAHPDENPPRNEWLAGLQHAVAALGALGRPDFSAHGDAASAQVFRQSDGRRTLVAWNPTDRPRPVQFHAVGKPLGEVVVPPRTIATRMVP